MIDNIFKYNPTKEELSEISSLYEDINETDYISELDKLTKLHDSSVEYEATVDLEMLFNLRGDSEKENIYRHKLDVDFADITNRLFNE